MNLDELRLEIDSIDDKLVELISQRMDVSAKIGEYKKQNNLPVYHPKREREKLNAVVDKTRDDLKEYMSILQTAL